MTQPPSDPNQPFPPGQYPPGQYPPPGYGYPPAQPPKKKHTVRNILIGVVLGFVLIVGGCLAMVGGAVSSVDKKMNENAGKTIRFEIESDSGTASNVTYSVNSGQQQETEVATPWSHEFAQEEGLQIHVLSASNGIDGGSGNITCRITADGEVLAENTSSGEYANVTCSSS